MLPCLQPVEWIKLKHLTILSVDKNIQQLELSYNAVGNVNRSTILENCLAISYKVKVYIKWNVQPPCDLAIAILCIFLREIKSTTWLLCECSQHLPSQQLKTRNNPNVFP